MFWGRGRRINPGALRRWGPPPPRPVLFKPLPNEETLPVTSLEAAALDSFGEREGELILEVLGLVCEDPPPLGVLCKLVRRDDISENHEN